MKYVIDFDFKEKGEEISLYPKKAELVTSFHWRGEKDTDYGSLWQL